MCTNMCTSGAMDSVGMNHTMMALQEIEIINIHRFRFKKKKKEK